MKRPVKYFVVDAFTESAFKGNQAAVCFLEEDHERDDSWLQSLAAEFELPLTCFLIPITGSDSLHPRCFHLRWFTSTAEMDICGHGTLASAHTLFSNGLVGSSETVEFSTNSGILTAKRVDDCEAKGSFLIEVNFPVITTCEYSSNDFSMFSKALDGAAIVDVKGTTKDKLVFQPLKGATKSTSTDQIMVVLSSWESVAELQPRTDEIMKCPGKVMIVTAAAPEGSTYDFCSRLFAPKLGLNEVKKLILHFPWAEALSNSPKVSFTSFTLLSGHSGLCMWKCTLFISTLLESQDEQM